jgi:hypothetical protein
MSFGASEAHPYNLSPSTKDYVLFRLGHRSRVFGQCLAWELGAPRTLAGDRAYVSGGNRVETEVRFALVGEQKG